MRRNITFMTYFSCWYLWRQCKHWFSKEFTKIVTSIIYIYLHNKNTLPVTTVAIDRGYLLPPSKKGNINVIQLIRCAHFSQRYTYSTEWCSGSGKVIRMLIKSTVNMVQASGLYFHIIPEKKINNAVNRSLREKNSKLKKKISFWKI